VLCRKELLKIKEKRRRYENIARYIKSIANNYYYITILVIDFFNMFQDTTQALNWRYATKKFDANKKIPNSDWQKIEDAFLLAPSSYGLQPWKFLVVTNSEVRDRLKVASWNQGQVTDCSHYVVLLGRRNIDEKYIDRYIGRIAEVRQVDVSALQGYRDLMVAKVAGKTSAHIPEFGVQAWSAMQTYIALGFAMTVAAMLEIDTCAIEGIGDLKEYEKVLNVPSEYEVLCGCAFGYRAEDDAYAGAKKVRFEKSDIISYI
jgi:nitroreductase